MTSTISVVTNPLLKVVRYLTSQQCFKNNPVEYAVTRIPRYLKYKSKIFLFAFSLEIKKLIKKAIIGRSPIERVVNRIMFSLNCIERANISISLLLGTRLM